MNRTETVDRLLLSRSFVEPLRFRPASDRFSVATHVLASHDAAELAIAAICTEKSVEVKDNCAFMDYFAKLKEKMHPTENVPYRDAMSQLNMIRVAIKHHGLMPEWEPWRNVGERTFSYITTWCLKYLQVDFASLDRSALILADSVRIKLQNARQHLQQGSYKECLETLTEAIAVANSELFTVGLEISPGDANAETALLLSGYGVDPGRFLTLQRLLPKRTFFSKGLVLGFKIAWEKRGYGHEANWTVENAQFAYDETVNLLTRLQSAVPYPTPWPYQSAFADVVRVKQEGARAVLMQWSFQKHWFLMGYRELRAGEELQSRRVYGALTDQPDNPEDESINLDESPFVVASGIAHLAVPTEGYFAFVLKREDVKILSVEIPPEDQ